MSIAPKYSGGHDPGHCVCTECNEDGLKNHLVSLSSPDGLSGLWRIPVKLSKTSNRIKMPCTCMDDAKKLNLYGACREAHMSLSYFKRFRKGVRRLGYHSSSIRDGGVSTRGWICIGDVLPKALKIRDLKRSINAMFAADSP
jgi:hypothetical protein